MYTYSTLRTNHFNAFTGVLNINHTSDFQMVVGVAQDVIRFLALYASTIIAFALCFHIVGNHKVLSAIYIFPRISFSK